MELSYWCKVVFCPKFYEFITVSTAKYNFTQNEIQAMQGQIEYREVWKIWKKNLKNTENWNFEIL